MLGAAAISTETITRLIETNKHQTQDNRVCSKVARSQANAILSID